MSFLSKLLGRVQEASPVSSRPPDSGPQDASSSRFPGSLPLNADSDDLVDGTLPPGPLLDVRTPQEYRTGRVKGAVNVNVGGLDQLLAAGARGEAD